MQKISKLLLICLLVLCSSFSGQNDELPYIVFNASKGVILKSAKTNEEFYPVRGTKLFENDLFLLKDERYFVKIKNTTNGEIYTFNGKGNISTRQIVNTQRYNAFDRFCSFLFSLAKEMGFNTTPLRTSQCVTYKGDNINIDSLSSQIASQIHKAIADSIYNTKVDIRKIYSSDNKSFHYAVQNNDSINYAMTLYTVTSDSIVHSQKIIVNKSGHYRTDEIAYIPLIGNYTLNLDYFSIATDEYDNITSYVILFNPEDFYSQLEIKDLLTDEIYKCSLNWDLIIKELIYQGNANRVIYIKK